MLSSYKGRIRRGIHFSCLIDSTRSSSFIKSFTSLPPSLHPSLPTPSQDVCTIEKTRSHCEALAIRAWKPEGLSIFAAVLISISIIIRTASATRRGAERSRSSFSPLAPLVHAHTHLLRSGARRSLTYTRPGDHPERLTLC